MAVSTVGRVRMRREALKAAGFRPVQIWAPDTRSAGFAEECRRQSNLIAEAEKEDREIAAFVDAALEDLAQSGEWR